MWNWHDLCFIVRRKRFTFHIQLNYPNHTIEKQLKTFRHGVAPLHSAQHRKFYAHARDSQSRLSGKLLGAMIMHGCRIVNGIKNKKHKKTALEQSGMLRIWRCDCALCVIGNEFPCRQPHNPSATLSRGLSTLPQG